MNHSGDANKMVDTPRTEAEVNRQKCWSDDLITIDANFACQLERELNAATSEIERLRKANLQLREGAEEQKQRIKRLEEALEECDWAFTKFCPEHESRYGDAWEKVRDALNRPNPFKPYWQEAKP